MSDGFHVLVTANIETNASNFAYFYALIHCGLAWWMSPIKTAPLLQINSFYDAFQGKEKVTLSTNDDRFGEPHEQLGEIYTLINKSSNGYGDSPSNGSCWKVHVECRDSSSIKLSWKVNIECPFCWKRHRFPKWCPKGTVLEPSVLSIRNVCNHSNFFLRVQLCAPSFTWGHVKCINML